MTDRFVNHASFAIERTYPASPERVFHAWSDPKAKAEWFGNPGDRQEFDFREGGGEHSAGRFDGGSYAYDATYVEIVPGERILFTYDMHLNGRLVSASVTTVELEALGDATRLTYTEQGAFLDGLDDPKLREYGTEELLDALGRVLERTATPA